MKLLILENEVYLAQSIAGKLSDVGYECTISQNIPKERVDYHAILISSNIYNQNCEFFIRQHSDSIIIMMISYISDDTVSKPLLAGARDYVLKPFMIDELVRKIRHYNEFAKNKQVLDFYNAYFDFIQKELNTPSLLQYNPPFIIKSTSQRSADIYAMKYAREKNILLEFITLKDKDYKNIFKNTPQKQKIYYATNLEELKKQERKEFLELAHRYPLIISFISTDKVSFQQVIDISHIPNTQELGGDIMSIHDYVKTIIAKFESRYPDIELAKKLGMSRKSLWEKRKKYGLLRKK
ncbi:response regulator [Helicobacter zhangjianzhongii]|uniref:Response regulator n=1 Tax=Helicobacter zhangjianzhongii TaxID=2974574 RepID=A0ACC6FTS3_9HELI|nr:MULTISPECIES: response regulator [unclassified Helicobacter]MDL0080680.1 response regulator [Helicobacter sp. CPD2-1]MDL0082619.1 response regulator [Helicobacter sp. XJK30-2]